MKKFFTLMVIAVITLTAIAQVPQKMSYQCVVRNSSGALVPNQAVGMKISILQGSATGTVVFSETYSPNPQTNANGLVTVEIGSGTAGTGTFSGINWASGPYFLKTETDPAGGTNYTITGTSQLLSVPYALYAKAAANVFSGEWTDITGKPAFSTVATSGSYIDLLNKPSLFSGSYNDLVNKPALFDGTWTSLTGKPTFANVAISGSYNDLLNKPTLFDGTWTSLSGKPAGFADGTDNVDDADNSITNEIQALSLSGTILTLSSGGGSVTLPSSGGGDNWGTQTVVTNTTLTGAGTTASPLAVANAVITPSWSKIQSIPAGFADGIDNIDDADNSITNEIQALSLSGTVLSLSNGGGSVTLPSSGGGDNWGTQVVITNNTLTGTGTALSPLAVANSVITPTWANIQSKPIFSAVATSGTFTDLLSKPTTVVGYGITDAVTLSGNQTITGIKTFNSDLLVNGLTIGRGTGAIQSNTATGNHALHFNSSGKSNTAVGNQALNNNSVGSWNSSMGDSAMFSNTSGHYNTAIGAYSLFSNTTGAQNTAIGYRALAGNTTAMYNTAIGMYALWKNTTGRLNTAVGNNALLNNDIGSYNTAIGGYTLWRNTTGYNNTANGSDALYENTTGTGNVGIGSGALHENTNGSRNSAIGSGTLYNKKSGDNNVAVGSAAGHLNSSGFGNVFLGYQAGYYETGSNKLFIDNQLRSNEVDARVKAMMYGVFDINPANQILAVNGKLGINTITPAYQLDVNGEITSRSMNSFRLRQSNYSVILRNDNDGFYLLLTNSGNPDGTWNALRPLAINLNTGNVLIGVNTNVGVGTFTPAYKLQVGNAGDGSQARANAWNLLSDVSLKKDLNKLTDPLNIIERINGYYFYWNTGIDNSRQVGLSAQEVKEVLPEVISEGSDGLLSIDYGKMVPLLLEAVKEQQKQIDKLKQLVSSLMQN